MKTQKKTLQIIFNFTGILTDVEQFPRSRNFTQFRGLDILLNNSANVGCHFQKKSRTIHQKVNQKLIRLPFWAGDIEVNATLKASLRRREEAPGAAARLAVRDAAHEAVAGVPRGVVARPVLRQGRCRPRDSNHFA